MIRIFLGLVFFLGISPWKAEAAQFCVGGAGISEQCLYDDAAQCLKATDPPNTYCTVNADAVLNYSGSSRYCVVSSLNTAECLYTDRTQCNNESAARRGICIDRVVMKDKNNPYRFDPRIQN